MKQLIKKLIKKSSTAIAISAVVMSFNVDAKNSGPRQITLKEAIEIAYDFSPELKSSIANLEATNELASQAFSGWLPTINASGNYGHQDIDVGGNVNDDTTDNVNLTASQPIFRGFETVNRQDQADNQIKAAQQNFYAAEQGVIFDAINAFFNLARDRQTYRYAVENEKLLQEQLTSTKQRFELGEVTITDVAQSESRLALAKGEKDISASNVTSSEAEFARVVGIWAGSLVAPKNHPVPPKTLDDATQIALANNPNLLAAHYNQLAAEDGVAVNKSALLPDVDLNGQISRQNNNFIGTDVESKTVTVNVTVPLYQGGAEYSRIRQANKEAMREKFNRDAVDFRTRSQVKTAWKEYKSTKTVITSNQAAVKAAETAYRGVQEEASLGVRSVLDVLDTKQALFSAQIQLVTAKRNHAIAAYRLQQLLGRLNPRDLGLNVARYDVQKSLDDVKYKLIGW